MRIPKVSHVARRKIGKRKLGGTGSGKLGNWGKENTGKVGLCAACGGARKKNSAQ